MAAAAVGAEAVIFVPAGQPPHKTDRVVSSAADRLAMLRLALRDRERAYICEKEIARSGPSYTVETLEVLRREYPGVELRLLIGADMAACFYQWREPRRILELAEPVVMMREPFDVEGLLSNLPTISGDEREAWRRRVVDVPRIEVSSTRLRDLLRERRYEVPEVRASLDAGVLDYIRQRGLYVGR